jgi:hypothetical protein
MTIPMLVLAYLAGVATPYVYMWADWRSHRTRKFYE